MWNQFQGSSDFANEKHDNNFDSLASSLTAMNEYDVQTTWQTMLQEQQCKYLMTQQPAALSSFYSTPNDYSYANSYMQDCNYSNNYPNFKYKSNQCLLDQQNEKSFEVIEPKHHAIKSQFSTASNFSAKVASEHNGSTSCEESDISDSFSNPASHSPLNLSQTAYINETIDGGSRKRKQYLRQIWYRERNKEYSRNWRSKKKQEEETLKSEINALREFKETIEETLDIHIHSTKEGLPFTFASKGFKKLIDCQNLNMNEIRLLDVVHQEDMLKVKQTVSDVLSSRQERTISFKLASPGQKVFRIKSKIRYTTKGLMFISTSDM